MMDRQIVYVLSSNYSGSHLLALQIASHSRCVSVGELHRFKQPKGVRRVACPICPDDEQCPVFQGLDGLSPERLYARLFQNVQATNANTSTLVDISKKASWAQRSLGLASVRQVYIHLVRDPRALVRRWMLTYQTSPRKAKVRWITARRDWRHLLSILAGPEYNVYAHKWAQQNREITHFIQRHALDARTVTYQDLVSRPQQVLGDLMPWLGLAFEPRQLEYWAVTHHGSRKKNYMAPPANGRLTPDLRWQDFLSSQVQQRVATHPEVVRYLDELGIIMNDAGLTLHPQWYAPGTVPVRAGEQS